MATAPLDISSLIGMSAEALVKKYGAPKRSEPTEYGFQWYVCNNKDYKTFFMAGVQDKVVVAAYSCAAPLAYGGKFKLGATRDTVRKAMGAPVGYATYENSTYPLDATGQSEYYSVGNNFVIVFYDMLRKGIVTSACIIPAELESKILVTHPQPTSDVVAAGRRIEVDLVNAFRVRNGLPACTANAELSKLALFRCTDMRTRNYFSHFSPDGKSVFDYAHAQGIRYGKLGEIISQGFHNCLFSHEAFLNSPAHRTVIVDKAYRKIGTGIAFGGSMYALFTDVFSN